MTSRVVCTGLCTAVVLALKVVFDEAPLFVGEVAVVHGSLFVSRGCPVNYMISMVLLVTQPLKSSQRVLPAKAPNQLGGHEVVQLKRGDAYETLFCGGCLLNGPAYCVA